MLIYFFNPTLRKKVILGSMLEHFLKKSTLQLYWTTLAYLHNHTILQTEHIPKLHTSYTVASPWIRLNIRQPEMGISKSPDGEDETDNRDTDVTGDGWGIGRGGEYWKESQRQRYNERVEDGVGDEERCEERTDRAQASKSSFFPVGCSSLTRRGRDGGRDFQR